MPPTANSAAPPGRTHDFRSVALVLGLCWLAVFFDGMDVNIYGAVMPHMLDDPGLGLTEGVAGTIGSWTTFGMLIGALVAGNVTDWLGRRPVLVWSVVLFSAGCALCALAPSAGVFGGGRFVAGLGLGGLMPTGLAMVAEFAPPRRAALAMGLLMTSYHAGGMAATGLGLGLAPALGWRWVFWAGALPALVAVPLLLKFLPESPGVLLAQGRRTEADGLADRYGMARPAPSEAPAGGAKGRLSAVATLFRGEHRWATPLLWVAGFCGLLLVYSVSTWLPQLMRASGYDTTSSIAFLMVINAGGIVGMLIAGRTADSFGAVRVASIWLLLTAGGTLLLKFPLPVAVAYVVVFLTGIWLFSGLTMVYAASDATYPASERAVGLGWITGVGRSGAIVGPWLGGVVLAGGSAAWGFITFAIAGAVGAVAVALVPVVRRISRTAGQPPTGRAPVQRAEPPAAPANDRV